MLVAENMAGVAKKYLTLSIIKEEWDDDDTTPPATNGVSTPVRLSLDAVPMAEFGQFVAKSHADNNRGFRNLYSVSWQTVRQGMRIGSVIQCSCSMSLVQQSLCFVCQVPQYLCYPPLCHRLRPDSGHLKELCFQFTGPFLVSPLQSLNGREGEHPVTVATTPANKPANRFANITACE